MNEPIQHALFSVLVTADTVVIGDCNVTNFEVCPKDPTKCKLYLSANSLTDKHLSSIPLVASRDQLVTIEAGKITIKAAWGNNLDEERDFELALSVTRPMTSEDVSFDVNQHPPANA